MTYYSAPYKPKAGEKWCNKCKEFKPLGAFPISGGSKERRHAYCKECRNKSAKETKKTNREANRLILLEHYGNKCERCGFDDVRALCIHHPNGRTEEEKGLDAYRTARYYIKNGFPDGLVVLCHNCHVITHREMQIE